MKPSVNIGMKSASSGPSVCRPYVLNRYSHIPVTEP